MCVMLRGKVEQLEVDTTRMMVQRRKYILHVGNIKKLEATSLYYDDEQEVVKGLFEVDVENDTSSARSHPGMQHIEPCWG